MSGKQKSGLAMSILVMDRQVDYMQNIADGCLMTLSPITTPCCRNTFVIIRFERYNIDLYKKQGFDLNKYKKNLHLVEKKQFYERDIK